MYMFDFFENVHKLWKFYIISVRIKNFNSTD